MPLPLPPATLVASFATVTAAAEAVVVYTAMLSVENIGARHDVWNVNVEAEYHEEKT